MGWSEDFSSKAENGDLTVGIIGLGYVGIPTAVGFHNSGFNVWGVDISQRSVDLIRKGINPTGDPEMDDLIPEPMSERWNITTSMEEAVPNCDVLIVTVPTPVTKDLKPNLDYVIDAGKSIFQNLRPGNRTIVVLESTVYPGVTRKTWIPIIEELELDLGIDVEIAYCPERFNPGDSAHGVRNVARVIGCDDELIGTSLISLYQRLTCENVSYVGRIEVAEAAKVVENVQRDINIALVNELARIFPELEVDVEDVLSAAATKWNFHRYTPGVGVGGHCIPVDPYYMIQRAEEVGVPTELITAARAVNRSMPLHVAQVIQELLMKHNVQNSEAKVLLLGWSYKAGLGDPRETPAEPLARALTEKGIIVEVFDPHIRRDDLPDLVSYLSSIEQAEKYDAVILVTAHYECLNIDWKELLKKVRTPLLYDGRRVLDLEKLESFGWICNAVGRPIGM